MARSDLTPKELHDRKIISANIRRFKENKGVTQTQLSKDLDIPKSTLSGYFNATSTPNPGNIQKLADYFDVKKSDIDPRFETPSNVLEVKRVDNIPIISEVACGQPIFSEDNFDRTLAFPHELLPGGNVFFVKASGDSMEPTIKNGELVLIREQEEVENGEIACVVFQDEGSYATLKRVRKQDGRVLLIPDNNLYLPYELKGGDNVRILGKAVKAIVDL